MVLDICVGDTQGGLWRAGGHGFITGADSCAEAEMQNICPIIDLDPTS